MAVIAAEHLTPKAEGGHQERMPAPITHTKLPYLRAWRMHRLLTVRGLAEQAGLAFSTVARIESGKAATGINAIKLARALDVTVRQLKEEEPQD